MDINKINTKEHIEWYKYNKHTMILLINKKLIYEKW